MIVFRKPVAVWPPERVDYAARMREIDEYEALLHREFFRPGAYSASEPVPFSKATVEPTRARVKDNQA